MRCPMLTMYATTFKPPEEYEDRDCLKEECAWWDENADCCAVLELSRLQNAIGNILGKLVDKMKPELFRSS